MTDEQYSIIEGWCDQWSGWSPSRTQAQHLIGALGIGLAAVSPEAAQHGAEPVAWLISRHGRRDHVTLSEDFADRAKADGADVIPLGVFDTSARPVESGAGNERVASEAAAAKPSELPPLPVAVVLERLDFMAGHEASAIIRDTAEAAAAIIRAALAAGLPPSPPKPSDLIWQFSINKGHSWCECSAEHAADAAKHGFTARALAVVSGAAPEPSIAALEGAPLPPLPPLPAAWLHYLRGQQVATVHPVPGMRAKSLFTADQTQEYARAAIAAAHGMTSIEAWFGDRVLEHAPEPSIAALEALKLARPFVEGATNQMYDGTNGHGIRAEARRRLAVIDAALAAHGMTSSEPDGGDVRCPYCDDTGDVHRADGEWLGTCTCPMGLKVRLADGKRAYCGRCDRGPAQAPTCPHGERCGLRTYGPAGCSADQTFRAPDPHTGDEPQQENDRG